MLLPTDKKAATPNSVRKKKPTKSAAKKQQSPPSTNKDNDKRGKAKQQVTKGPAGPGGKAKAGKTTRNKASSSGGAKNVDLDRCSEPSVESSGSPLETGASKRNIKKASPKDKVLALRTPDKKAPGTKKKSPAATTTSSANNVRKEPRAAKSAAKKPSTKNFNKATPKGTKSRGGGEDRVLVKTWVLVTRDRADQHPTEI